MSSNFDLVSPVGEQSRELEIVSPLAWPFQHLQGLSLKVETTMTPYGKPQIGCYFDGAQGQQYNDIRVLKLAIGYGWNDADALAIVDADELTDEQSEWLHETVQEAEDYLNTLETRSYLSWQWNEGDFGLYPDVDGAREDVGFVSHSSRNHNDECDPDDAAYPNAEYRGEWLHVTDHGNATLYVRGDDGKDTEIWSVV